VERQIIRGGRERGGSWLTCQTKTIRFRKGLAGGMAETKRKPKNEHQLIYYFLDMGARFGKLSISRRSVSLQTVGIIFVNELMGKAIKKTAKAGPPWI